MQLSSFLRHYRIRSWLLYALIALMALVVVGYALGTSAILRDQKNAHASAIAMLEGREQKPYIYRALMPVTTRLIVAVTPDFIQNGVVGGVETVTESRSFKRFLNFSKWKNFSSQLSEPEYVYAVTVLVVLLYGILIVYGITLHRLSLSFFPDYHRVAFLAPLFGLLVLLPFIKPNFKIYDPMTLCTSALCLLFLYTQRWRAYMITFIIACLNKETAILQTALFAIAFHRLLPRHKFVTLLAAQCIIYAGIKLLVNDLFDAQPGQMMYFKTLPVIGMTFPNFTGYHMLILISIWWLITAHWQELPQLLRQSLWLAAACTAMYYLLGTAYGYRIFFDCFPGMTVIAAYTLFRPVEKA